MGLLESIKSSKKETGRRCVIYSTHGWGKSTLASKFPAPVFIPTEDGLADLDVPAFPLASCLQEAWQPVMELAHENAEHEFKTVVLDTVDWLERLIWKSICDKHDKNAITDFTYGTGYGEATAKLDSFLRALDDCRRIRGMNCVVLAHCKIEKFRAPDNETYDVYAPKLHRDASELLQEWADEVFFGHYAVYTQQTDEGFGKKRNIATGGERVVKALKAPGWNAKNRCGLPAELDCELTEYLPHLAS